MIIYFILTILKRSYRYFVLSFLSLSVGALLLSCVLTISTSVNTFFIRESKVLLGGDLVLNAAKPFALDSSLQNFLQGEGHILDEESRVSAVFSTDEERTSPSSIRVVSNQFPLYGTILLSEGAFFLDRSHIIIDSALAKKLQKTKGNTITLNGASYTISGILAREPDAINVGLSFAPRVIMTKEAFESASIDLSESRASYYLRIKENPLKPLSNNIRDSIQVFAKENKLRYDSALDGPNNLVRGAKSLSLFAFIVLVIALILVTVNIIANLAYVYSKFKKTIALLKAFGITTYELRLIFIGILLLLGIVSGIVGSTLGRYDSVVPTFPF
jgi:putative ABC transport system permease protein